MSIDHETLWLAQERFRDKQRNLDVQRLMVLLIRLDEDDLEALVSCYRRGDEKGMGGLLRDHIDLALWEAALSETRARVAAEARSA